MRTVLIIIGVVALILCSAFCWLLIAGADQSRKRSRNQRGGGIGESTNDEETDG